tara:strand:+ start:944 stop:1462 length:519 start_codon:yes stop_codon:yes gene_type:complete
MIKQLKGYENLYSINNKKEISKLSTGRILKVFKLNGYDYVSLSKNGKRRKFKVSNLMAENFGFVIAHRYREQFKPVIDFENRYEVSNHGRVVRLAHTNSYGRYTPCRLLKPSLSRGYLTVTLFYDGGANTYNVGLLVGRSFLGMQVNTRVYYISDNKQDNNLKNLTLKKYHD